jgi:MFS transporter, NNP family, nitrate/nitrite transporter
VIVLMDIQMHHSEKSPADSFYKTSQLTPIAYLVIIFFITFIARIILSPLMIKIEPDLGLNHAQAGRLFLLLSIGYFISLTGAGYISSIITYRKTIAASVTAVGISLCAVAFCRTLPGVQLSIFILGMAAGLYLPSGIAALTEMVHSRHWGKAIALHEIAPNFAFVAAPIISEILLPVCSWRSIITAIGVIALVTGGVFLRYGRGGDFTGSAPGLSDIGGLISGRSFWLLLLLFGLSISSTIGIYTMLPLYLIHDVGLFRGDANLVVGSSRIFGLFSALISGWATDRFGGKPTIMVSSILAGSSTILLGLKAYPTAIVPIVYIQAILATLFFPAGFKILSSIYPAETRGAAVSYTIPLAFVFGGGMIPAFIGFMGDRGAFSAGIMITGVLILSGTALPMFINIKE